MKSNSAESIEDQAKVIRGIEPHPEFATFSDSYLELRQGLIDQKIAWAKEDGDDFAINWYEIEMALLHAERARRNGGPNLFPHLGDKTVRNKFQAQTWGKFVATDFGGQPYTIQDLLPDQGLAVIHGRGKEQKTTLVIHECRAVATGQAFLGKPTQQKKVLYLNYEMPFAYLQKLLSAGGTVPDDAYVLNRPEPVLTLETIDYLFENLVPGGLMVVDSFRGAFRLRGEAENHAGGAGVILRGLQDIALKHKGLLQVIHHRNRNPGKDGTDAISGTSDWIAAPDIIWSWSRPDKEKPGMLIVEGRMPPIDPLSVSVSPEECLFLGSVKESQERTDKETILAALTEDGQSADAIAQATGLPPGTTRARLESLFKPGLVNRDGEANGVAPFCGQKLIPQEIIP
jgi:AAA domain